MYRYKNNYKLNTMILNLIIAIKCNNKLYKKIVKQKMIYLGIPKYVYVTKIIMI